MPIAAVTQIVADVVRPWTSALPRRMAPAPRKPMPVTICAAIRSEVPPPFAKAIETIVNSAEPRPISVIVRRPAGLWWYSRSRPSAALSPAASSSRITRTFVVMSKAALVRGGAARGDRTARLPVERPDRKLHGLVLEEVRDRQAFVWDRDIQHR